MTNCAVGSTRGYDELYPQRIDLVKETKKYRKVALGDDNDGMMKARKVCPLISWRLLCRGFY